MPINALEYDFSQAGGPGAEMRAAPSREEEAKREQELNRTRMALAGALNPLPLEAATSLPMTGGLIGGLAGAKYLAPLLGNVPVAGRYLPSLAGTVAGTTAGTVAEQAVLGRDILTKETAQKMLENAIEGAAFDLGGNLVFSAAGKVYNVGKDKLEQLGFKKGLFDSPDSAARKAAQEWLTSGNVPEATLTKGQLTGDTFTQQVEGTLRYSPGGAGTFAKQQQGVQQRLQEGVNNVFTTLETSPEFKQAVKDIQGGIGTTTVPMEVGNRFQALHKAAEQTMKDKYQPVYQRMEMEGDGLRINMQPLKEQAQKEIDTILKREGDTPSAAAQAKLDVLNQIIAKPNELPFSAVHSLRSDLLASARDLTKEGLPATTSEAYYKKYASKLKDNMDYVAVLTFGNEEERALARKLGLGGGIDQAAGLRSGQYKGSYQDLDTMLPTIGRTDAKISNNDLLRSYWNAQDAYGSAMEGLYSGTMRAALKDAPSAVGDTLFSMQKPDNFKEFQRALGEMKKYAPDQAKTMLGEVQYGYLYKMFDSPDSILQFAKNMDNATYRDNFNFLFRDTKTRQQLKDIANAAKYGLEKEAGGTALRTKAITAAVGATELGAAGLLYFALPDSVKDNLDPTQLAISGTALVLTPRIMAKALTNPQAMSALAGIANIQKSPAKYGAVAAKLVDSLNKSGVIDSQDLNEINTLIHGKAQGQQQQSRPINSLDYNFGE